MIEYLTGDDLIDIARIVLDAPPPVRDYGLLSSAAVRPATIASGQEAYPDLFCKAAALLHSITMNHALVDGNKRTAWAATVTFLALNGHSIPKIDVDAAESLVLAIADGSMREVADLAKGLRALYRI